MSLGSATPSPRAACTISGGVGGVRRHAVGQATEGKRRQPGRIRVRILACDVPRALRPYQGVPMQIRSDLTDAQAKAWAAIGDPGTWWTGVERVAIVAETRHADSC